MLMFVTASAVTGTELVNRNEVLPVHSEKNIQDRAMWDVQFIFNASQQTGCISLAGIGFDGTYFYCPDWLNPTIYRFNKNGTYLDSFIIQGVPNLIDLAYDGTYFYGQGQSTTDIIYVMNFTAHTLVTTMPCPYPAWNIAYDAEQDRFWIGQWDSPMYLIDRTGVVWDTFTIPGTRFGIAWDPFTQIAGYDGPFLWFSTGAGSNYVKIKVIDLATKTLVPGVEHNVSAELGEGSYGGLEFTIDYQTGFGTLFGMVQGIIADDYAFGYEITIINEPPSADFSWTPQNPSVNQEITFNASASQDSDGTITLFEWDWDNDGVYDESQSSPTTTHSWTSPGSYPVTVRVTDDDTATANVTKTVEVGGITLEIDINGGIGVKAIITNKGASDATDISWQIHVEGGMLGMINKTVNGTIDITAGGSKTVGTGMILGFGAISIVAKVADEEQTATGTQLIIFSLVK
jgi:hypothetical protein